MNVELEKRFPLEHAGDKAWSILSDIEAVAGCMPGAEITEVVDANNFKGKVKVRLGPVQMEFNGDISVQSVSPDQKQIHLIAEGTDKKGTTSATMDLTANVEAGTESSSALLGDAKVVVNGKLASFGQRMMAQVPDQILDQFADNFRAKLGEADASSGAAAGETATDAAVPGVGGPSVDGQDLGDQDAAPAAAKPAASNEINGFKFMLDTIVGLITGLFKRK